MDSEARDEEEEAQQLTRDVPSQNWHHWQQVRFRARRCLSGFKVVLLAV